MTYLAAGESQLVVIW